MSNDLPGGRAWSHLWETFHAVRAAEPNARATLLEQLCRGQAGLEAELRQLLEADQTESPLDREPLVVVPPDDEDPPATLRPGMLLCGRFEIVRLIGQGGMGSVWEASDRSLGGRVALKTLLPAIAHDGSALRRFYREIDLARQVTHPNACRLFDLFEHRDEESGQVIAFVTMELLEGETLAERLRRQKLSSAEALEIARQVAAALDAAHSRGIIHRDLKPGNVMLTGTDGAGRVVVTDFGLALRSSDSTGSGPRVTRSGQLFGTPEYMAPEQLLDGEISPRTDVYALGLLLYEMVTGSVPFRSDSPFNAAVKRLRGSVPSPREMTPTIEKSWERTILRCLERDPEDRFQSASEVMASLSGVTSPIGPTQRRRLMRGVFLTLAGALLLLAGIVGFRAARPRPAVTRPETTVIRMTNSGNVVASALSSDGRFVAYALREDGAHSLWIKQVATGATARIAAPGAIRYQTLAISPDGNYVYAMARVPDGDIGLFQVPILGGEPRRVVSHDGPPEFSLSPNGTEVVFRTVARGGALELIVATIADGAKRVVLRRPATQSLYLPAWSLDGSRIVFGTSVLSPKIERRIEEVTLATGQVRTIRHIDWPYVASIAWLHDGEHLLVAAYEHEQPPQVWLVPIDGSEPTKVTNDVSAYYSASPAADGKTFAALRGEGSARVWLMRAGPDGSARPIRPGFGNYAVLAGARVFSSIPNMLGRGGLRWVKSDRIVFTGEASGRRTLLVADREGGEPRPVAEQYAAWQPEVSADGRTVAFISDRSGGHQVWTVGIDGSNPQQITSGNYVHTMSMTAGDLLYFAVSDPPGVWRLPLEGGTPQRILDVSIGRLAVSPDGAWFLRSNPRGRGLILQPIDAGQPRTFAVPRHTMTHIVRFGPGAESFSFIDWKDGIANIWRQSIDGGEPRQVTSFTSGEIYAFDWSRDGQFLAVAHGEPSTDVVLVRNFR